MGYNSDRTYTDRIHKSIAVKILYNKLGWVETSVNLQTALTEDIDYAIDYRAKDKNKRDIIIQERFRRESTAHLYQDITFRFTRDESRYAGRQLSEWYKMLLTVGSFTEPYYFVYGVVRDNTMFLARYVVVDLREFFSAVNAGIIRIDPSVNSRIYSFEKDNIIYAGTGMNRDASSSFLSFDVQQLKKIVPECVILEEGF